MSASGASYLSAVSIMLAAYGFFFGNYGPAIAAGLEVGDPSGNQKEDLADIKKVTAGRTAALLLGVVPLAVWLIFLGPVIEEIEAAANVSFSLSRYSAVDVAFFAAANAWLVIAILQLVRAGRLWAKLSDPKWAKARAAMKRGSAQADGG